MIRIQAMPDRISCIQYSHRQPVASARKPPTSGPMAGPTNGAALKAAIGTPRSSFFHKSDKVPPTNVIGALNAIPSIALQTIRVAMLSATAQGTIKTTAINRVVA